MAKKDKRNITSRSQPNAPEFQQILPQPPHNPYYPDPTPQIHQPPPPYSSHLSHSSAANYHSVPMSQLNDISYPRVSPHVVVQAPGIPYDHRADRYKRKVRSFNNQTMIIAFFAILLSISAYQMYSNRNCISQFVIHKPSKDIEVRIADIRDMHLNIACASGIIIFLCLVRSAFGYNDKTYGCYLLLIGLMAFFTTLNAGYLVYLSFYSPCAPSLGELGSNIAKTFLSKITDSLPSPDKGAFGESNVISMSKDDPYGLTIFILDVINFIFYFSIFFTSMLLC